MKFDLLIEKYYNSRKPVKGYIESEELIGKHLWVHTNRTYRNDGYNGMLGIYGVNSKGNRTGSPLNYTNDIKLKSPIVFQVPDPSSAGLKTYVETGKRTLLAGVSGIVTESNENTSGFEAIDYNPTLGYFLKLNDPDKKKIIGASEVYFHADEDGKYQTLAKGIIVK
jgi:hypothetical protein